MNHDIHYKRRLGTFYNRLVYYRIYVEYPVLKVDVCSLEGASTYVLGLLEKKRKEQVSWKGRIEIR